MKFLSEFDSFLMYIDNHTISQNFLKISMFSNKKFTFSSSAQLFEKNQHFSQNFNFFPQNWHFCTKLMLRKTLVTLLQRLHDMILSLGAKYFICWKIVTLIQKYHFIDILDKSVIFLVKLDVNLENNDNWFQK